MATVGRAPGPLVWTGMVIVICGLTVGLRPPPDHTIG
jgi:hypothetical protein